MALKKSSNLSNIYRLLKAEAFCAELIHKSFNFDNISVKFASAFRRNYRNDLESVAFETKDDNSTIAVKLVINRDGIYDKIPEGVFHQSRGSGRTQLVSDMAGEHRRYKEEEKQARLFFLPLEQAFFKYATLAEVEEQLLCIGMLEGSLKNELSTFWNLEPGLPQNAKPLFARMMPWVHLIKGNLELTAKVLALLLDKPVEATEKEKFFLTASFAGFALGDAELGFNSVCGNSFSEPSLTWKFSILEISQNELYLYTDSMPYGKLLKQFEEIFLPVAVDILYEYEKSTDEKSGDEILGFGFTL